MNQHAKCRGQTSFRSYGPDVAYRHRHRDAYTPDCLFYLDHDDGR